MALPRVWLITGASSGFGRAMAELALSKGDKVVATLRNPSELAELQQMYTEDQLRLSRLDVAVHDEILRTFQEAKDAFGRVDVVFNNAGRSVYGEAEGTPPDLARGLFDINFWGAVNVSTEAVRFFREENEPRGGVLLNHSSYLGICTFPRAAFYNASKHALDGFTETLISELDPAWGIKVILVSPGFVRTSMPDKLTAVSPHPAYTHPIKGLDVRWGDVRKVVARIYEASLLQDPPMRLFLGEDANVDVKAKAKMLVNEVEAFASWSEGLMEDH